MSTLEISGRNGFKGATLQVATLKQYILVAAIEYILATPSLNIVKTINLKLLLIIKIKMI